MSANMTDAEVDLLTTKRAENPNRKTEELEKVLKIKSLKSKIEILLYKDSHENIYKKLRQESKKLDVEFRATSDRATKLQLLAKHNEIKIRFKAIRTKIEEFCRDIYNLGNAALVAIPSGDDRAFYEKMMAIIKNHTALYVPLFSDIKENIEQNVIDSTKKQKPDEKVYRSLQSGQSFQETLAALNISNHATTGPQPVAARLVIFQSRGNTLENKDNLLKEQRKQDPSQ